MPPTDFETYVPACLDRVLFSIKKIAIVCISITSTVQKLMSGVHVVASLLAVHRIKLKLSVILTFYQPTLDDPCIVCGYHCVQFTQCWNNCRGLIKRLKTGRESAAAKQ